VTQGVLLGRYAHSIGAYRRDATRSASAEKTIAQTIITNQPPFSKTKNIKKLKGASIRGIRASAFFAVPIFETRPRHKATFSLSRCDESAAWRGVPNGLRKFGPPDESVRQVITSGSGRAFVEPNLPPRARFGSDRYRQWLAADFPSSLSTLWTISKREVFGQ
jgi:hypothetical protein